MKMTSLRHCCRGRVRGNRSIGTNGQSDRHVSMRPKRAGAGPVGSPAFVTQNGWNLNLLNEAGQAFPPPGPIRLRRRPGSGPMPWNEGGGLFA